jgi:NADP-dependent 3-hydroxy acid dehydrogenase YdfG
VSERVVLVTGALAGIGRATTTAFDRQGAAAPRHADADADGQSVVWCQ